MKKIVSLVVLLAAVTSAHADGKLRTSTLGADPVLRGTLLNALRMSSGKVSLIRAEGTGYTLSANQDRLTCSDDGCTLTWDTVSPTYPQDAAAFESSLLAALDAWATSSQGTTDPSIHRVTYVQTGSTMITVTDHYGSSDEVDCSVIKGAGGTSTTECSFVVSDVIDGASADLQALYTGLLTGFSLLPNQLKALTDSVSTSQFLTPGKPQVYEVVHTLYTDLLSDSYTATGYYDYVKPIMQDGSVISNGITLTLSGGLTEKGTYVLQSAQAQSYARSHPIPLTVNSNSKH